MSYFTEIFGSDAPIAKSAHVPAMSLDDPLFDFAMPTGAGDVLAKTLVRDDFARSLIGEITDAVVGHEGVCVPLAPAPEPMLKRQTSKCGCKCARCARNECERCEAERKCKNCLALANAKTRKRRIGQIVSEFRKHPVFAHRQYLTDDSGILVWDRIADSCASLVETAIREVA